MAKNSARRNSKDSYECCGHHHGGKPVVIGLLLLVIGAALDSGYNWPEILMLVGGILVVKGILIMLFKKNKS